MITHPASRQALRTKRLFGFTLGSMARLFVIVGVILVVLSVASLVTSRSDVTAEIVALGPDGLTPALHLLPVLIGEPDPGSTLAPGAGQASSLGTVVVVHGFAGSKEFMRDIDYSLARAGFEIYGVDVPGHGHSGLRLDSDRLVLWFTDLLKDMLAKGQITSGQVYLVGHSLGTLVVTKGALESPDAGIRGLVALSPIFSAITPTAPANYLALFGQSELPGVQAAAIEALKAGAGVAEPELETVYGDFAAGTARAAAMVKDASHISIPDSPEAIASAIKWLTSSAGSPVQTLPRIEREKTERSFGLLGVVTLLLGLFYFGAGFLGLLGHAPRRPEAQSVIEDARLAAGLPRQPVVVVSMAGKASIIGESLLPEAVVKAKAKATQLYAGTRAIPLIYALAAGLAAIMVGLTGGFTFIGQTGADYLTLYFLMFAVFVVPLLWLTARFLKTGPLVESKLRLGAPISLGLGLVLFLVMFFGLGSFETFAWTAFLPPVSHWGHILLVALFLLPFSVIDEVVRGTTHDRTGFWWGLLVTVIGKFIVIISWYAGLLLPVKPQALIVVAPVLVGALVFLDVFLSLLYNEHGSWLASALFKALVLAWLATAIFPFVAAAVAFG